MADMLSAGLAWLDAQLAADGAVPIESADIYVEEFATDAYGEEAATRVLETPGLSCQVLPMTADRLGRQGRDASMRMVRILFASRPWPDSDRARVRLIVVGDRTYRPDGILDLASAGLRWRVDCELVTS